MIHRFMIHLGVRQVKDLVYEYVKGFFYQIEIFMIVLWDGMMRLKSQKLIVYVKT